LIINLFIFGAFRIFSLGPEFSFWCIPNHNAVNQALQIYDNVKINKYSQINEEK